MKILILVFFVFGLISPTQSQVVTVNQYTFYCESNSYVDGKFLKERIRSMERTSSGNLNIELIVLDECNVSIYPGVKIERDTLVVTSIRIEKQELELTNGKRVVILSQPHDCECAYELRLELQVDDIGGVIFNTKRLELTDERFKTFPIRYFVYKSDTTGYVDKYGLRQGCYLIEKKDHVLKTYYEDNNCTLVELWDRKKQLIKRSTDCGEFISQNNR